MRTSNDYYVLLKVTTGHYISMPNENVHSYLDKHRYQMMKLLNHRGSKSKNISDNI